ncbi:hypothetical protein PMAC_003201 [Pneumocystis sp. 'macacae']|nr:hypothetical protein PMAC_001049 [Pneumocystis sp. 'macacae']KAG5518017.1 hypothetical protein PMAC_003201 [Pneumocystis sp. 'macacae']
MKAFVLAGFLGIAHAFSKNIEHVHKRSISLNSSQILPLYVDEEGAFALILKENAINGQCKIKLQEYCENVRNKTQVLKKVFPELLIACEEDKLDEKCNDLKESIIERCKIFKQSLQHILVKASATLSNCLIQDECIFLEGVCPEELKEGCNYLRTLCREKIRDNLKIEFLLKAFSGDLKIKEACEQVINKKCFMFMEESDELMKFCITSDRCGRLMKLMEDKCMYLKFDIEDFIKNSKISKKQCNSLLEECYFHKSDCNNTLENLCKELEKKCEKETKHAFFTLEFCLMGKEITLVERIIIKKIFEDEIGKPGIKDTIDLLALISDNNLDNCETNLEKCYEFCSFLPQLENLYDNTKKKMSKTEVCTTLKEKLKPKCKDLKLKLYNLLLSNTSEDNEDAAILEWTKQSPELDENLCTDLESKCFYLEKLCSDTGIKIINACINTRSACLKTRLFRRDYQIFQSILKGKLHNLALESALKTCINGLLNICSKIIDIENSVSLDFCLQPWNTCHMLAYDIEIQTQEFRTGLDRKRDFPSEENCKELEKKCEILGQDSKMNDLPCLTVKERCNHLRNAKELKEILLERQVKKLSDLDICIEKVSEICNNMSKRKRMRFVLSCIQLNTTCQMITRDIKFKCTTLGKNIDFMKVLEKTKDIGADKGPECDLWEPYCDKYMSNCEKLVEDNGKDGKCKKLKENCKSYRESQDKEKEIMYKLQGSLNENNCESALDKHCLDWAEIGNDTFKNFCIDSTGAKNDTIKTELCKKLAKRMKERCTELSTKLESMVTEIQKSVEAVKELNKIADNALENVKFTLNKQKTGISNAALSLLYNANANIKTGLKEDTVQKNQSEYVQQKDADVNITDREAMAFDAAIEALEVYTEVKAECKDLLLECGFKKDCSEYKDSCEKIEEACNKLEPLKLMSSGKEIINGTVIETTTVTETRSDGKQKTVIVEGQCVLVRTTDKWVTSISTYTRTSVVTSTVTPSQCKPTKCEGKAGDVKLGEGMRVTRWNFKGVILAMIILAVV